MNKKLERNTILPILTIDLAVMLLLSVICMFFNLYAGLACAVISVLVRLFHLYFSQRKSRKEFDKIRKNIEEEFDVVNKALISSSPLMTCMVATDGRLIWANDAFVSVFETESSFKEAAGSAFIDVFFGKDGISEDIIVGDESYTVQGKQLTRPDGTIAVMLFWFNTTELEKIKQESADRRFCAAVIDIDNYDEIIESTSTEEQSLVAAAIDKEIQNWAIDMGAAISKQRNSRYFMVFENRFMSDLIKRSFPILDNMHEIVTGADFPTSISVGVASGDLGFAELFESAQELMELAQARGGDQVALRNNNSDVEYFGGTLPAVEKRSKGKSRVMAHVLSRRIQDADKVFVMGHKNPDMDAFGAAIGMYTLAENLSKSVSIVMNEPSDAVEAAFNQAIESGRYIFETHDEALARVTKDSLIIVVDNHIAAISECPQLLESGARIAVIDHHRKSENAIERISVSHMESYASSASELVTELLQYSQARDNVSRFAANVLLAGIMLDTKNFLVNTGVRTFEAASWLRRKGADNADIRAFFKMRLDLYQKKANIIASAEILTNGIAVAYTRDSDEAMQMVCAQAADSLLDMNGVEAAFVAGRSLTQTVISARSLGKVNVQVIMEDMGGGGHQNVAAAQVDEGPEESIAKIVNIMREKKIL